MGSSRECITLVSQLSLSEYVIQEAPWVLISGMYNIGFSTIAK